MGYFRAITELLTNKNFALFWVCMLISQVGDYLQITTQGWLALEMSNSAFAVSLVAASGTIPQLLFVIIGGIAADRYPKKLFLKALAITQLLISAALSVLVIFNWANVLTVFVFTFLLGHLCCIVATRLFILYPTNGSAETVGECYGIESDRFIYCACSWTNYCRSVYICLGNAKYLPVQYCQFYIPFSCPFANRITRYPV